MQVEVLQREPIPTTAPSIFHMRVQQSAIGIPVEKVWAQGLVGWVVYVKKCRKSRRCGGGIGKVIAGGNAVVYGGFG